MLKSTTRTITRICRQYGNDRSRLLDIARDVQAEQRCVSSEAMDEIAAALAIPRVEVESLVSFYAFLSERPLGQVVIRLCDDIIDRMHGYERVLAAFSEELGIGLGETTPDGRITLERTACMGMSDQAPAALINDVPVTRLSSDRAREIARELRTHMDPSQLVGEFGTGNNAHPLVRAVVRNNLRRAGPVIFSPLNRGEALRKALAMSPAEVIRAIKTARLRGRGGAGFPCGMKWEFTRAAEGERKIIICNADEGEPGTFKDRVILTERADRVFAGMTIAGYAIGAQEGIVYLRAEYAYLRRYLDSLIEQRREDNLLGKDILGHEGLDFDIRIQMGAGAYVCGEETALISSCEGLRGDPKTRPPFPAQQGYLGCPTSVNNVETLCCAAKIIEEGPATFSAHGTAASSGTKLLSISGDCHLPGVYEVPLSTPLREVLEMAGGDDAIAVQVGGPSGQLVDPTRFDQAICFDHLSTGGALMVFGPHRNLMDVVHAFLEFFVDESCGFCTPCRVGNVLLLRTVERLMDNRGEPADLEQMQRIGVMMRSTSRCGLGQTSANPVLTSLEHFRPMYSALVHEAENGDRRSFDLEAATAPAHWLRHESARKGHN